MCWGGGGLAWDRRLNLFGVLGRALVVLNFKYCTWDGVSGVGPHKLGVVAVKVFRMCIGAVAPICVVMHNTRPCSLPLWFLIISLIKKGAVSLKSFDLPAL